LSHGKSFTVEPASYRNNDIIKLHDDYVPGCGNGAVPEGRTRRSFDLSIPLAQRPMPARSHNSIHIAVDYRPGRYARY